MKNFRKILVTMLLLCAVLCTAAFAVSCSKKHDEPAGPASNAITSVSLEGWTYGETANTPTATAAHGTATFTYSSSENGEYTTTVPTDAGTYYVKATVAATSDYEGAEKTASFTIAKANNAISTVSELPRLTRPLYTER